MTPISVYSGALCANCDDTTAYITRDTNIFPSQVSVPVGVETTIHPTIQGSTFYSYTGNANDATNCPVMSCEFLQNVNDPYPDSSSTVNELGKSFTITINSATSYTYVKVVCTVQGTASTFESPVFQLKAISTCLAYEAKTLSEPVWPLDSLASASQQLETLPMSVMFQEAALSGCQLTRTQIDDMMVTDWDASSNSCGTTASARAQYPLIIDEGNVWQVYWLADSAFSGALDFCISVTMTGTTGPWIHSNPFQRVWPTVDCSNQSSITTFNTTDGSLPFSDQVIFQESGTATISIGTSNDNWYSSHCTLAACQLNDDQGNELDSSSGYQLDATNKAIEVTLSTAQTRIVQVSCFFITGSGAAQFQLDSNPFSISFQPCFSLTPNIPYQIVQGSGTVNAYGLLQTSFEPIYGLLFVRASLCESTITYSSDCDATTAGSIVTDQGNPAITYQESAGSITFNTRQLAGPNILQVTCSYNVGGSSHSITSNPMQIEVIKTCESPLNYKLASKPVLSLEYQQNVDSSFTLVSSSDQYLEFNFPQSALFDSELSCVISTCTAYSASATERDGLAFFDGTNIEEETIVDRKDEYALNHTLCMIDCFTQDEQFKFYQIDLNTNDCLCGYIEPNGLQGADSWKNYRFDEAYKVGSEVLQLVGHQSNSTFTLKIPNAEFDSSRVLFKCSTPGLTNSINTQIVVIGNLGCLSISFSSFEGVKTTYQQVINPVTTPNPTFYIPIPETPTTDSCPLVTQSWDEPSETQDLTIQSSGGSYLITVSSQQLEPKDWTLILTLMDQTGTSVQLSYLLQLVSDCNQISIVADMTMNVTVQTTILDQSGLIDISEYFSSQDSLNCPIQSYEIDRVENQLDQEVVHSYQITSEGILKYHPSQVAYDGYQVYVKARHSGQIGQSLAIPVAIISQVEELKESTESLPQELIIESNTNVTANSTAGCSNSTATSCGNETEDTKASFKDFRADIWLDQYADNKVYYVSYEMSNYTESVRLEGIGFSEVAYDYETKRVIVKVDISNVELDTYSGNFVLTSTDGEEESIPFRVHAVSTEQFAQNSGIFQTQNSDMSSQFNSVSEKAHYTPNFRFLRVNMPKVDVDGRASLKFNDSLPEFDVSQLNQNNSLAYIEVDEARQRLENFDPTKLNFTWTASRKQNSDRVIELKLEWEDPFAISEEDKPDDLIFVFNQSKDLFLSKDVVIVSSYSDGSSQQVLAEAKNAQYALRNLKKQEWKVSARVARQLPQDEATESIMLGAEMFSFLGVVVLILAVVLGKLGENKPYMAFLIRCLVMVTKMPVFLMKWPANFLGLMDYLDKIVLFDYLSFLGVWDWAKANGIESEKDFPMKYKSEQAATGAHDSFQNLETVAVIMLFLTAQIILSLFLKLLKRFKIEKLDWLHDFVSYKLFFAAILQLTVDTFIELSFAACINLYNPYSDDAISILGLIITAAAVLFCFIIFPIGCVVVVIMPYKKFSKNEQLNDLYGWLLEGIKKQSRMTRAYWLFYFVRKVFFVFIGVVNNNPGWALIWLQTQCAVNITYTLYFQNYRPWEEPLFNQIEILDETMVHFITLQSLLCTDILIEPITRHSVGWIMYGLTCTVVVVNVFTMINEQIHFCKLLYLKWQDAKNRKIMSKYMKRKLKVDMMLEKVRILEKKFAKEDAREQGKQQKLDKKKRKQERMADRQAARFEQYEELYNLCQERDPKYFGRYSLKRFSQKFLKRDRLQALAEAQKAAKQSQQRGIEIVDQSAMTQQEVTGNDLDSLGVEEWQFQAQKEEAKVTKSGKQAAVEREPMEGDLSMSFKADKEREEKAQHAPTFKSMKQFVFPNFNKKRVKFDATVEVIALQPESGKGFQTPEFSGKNKRIESTNS